MGRQILLVLLLPALLAALPAAPTTTTSSSSSSRLCSMADRDGDGRVDPGELHGFLRLFGASHDGPSPSLVNDGPSPSLVNARLRAVLRRADPGAGGAHASCGALFHEAVVDAAAAVGAVSAGEQFHLALTGSPSERRLTFATVGRGAPVHASCALSDGRNFTGLPYSYNVPARWWQPEGWVGSLYNVTFTGLQPGQSYSYSCLGSSATHTFVTVSTNTSSFPTHFATFGDMGTFMPLGFDVFQALARSHATAPFDFVLQQGDISYAGVDTAAPVLNITKGDEFEYIWDLFGRQIESVSSTLPWMTGVGNHEAWYNFSAFRARYPMPGEASDGEGNFWYSFDYAGVHVVSASSEHDLSDGSPQLAWIARDLKAANENRHVVPWVVFAIHRPLYSSDAGEFAQHSPGSYRLRQLEGLLLENNVDLTVAGHQHAYERCHPARNGTVLSRPQRRWHGEDVYEAPDAPVHLMVGSAGAFQNERWINPAPAWSGKRFNATAGHAALDGYGFVRVTLFNRTHMRARFESVSGENSSLSDAFWVVKYSNS
jgi:hypothetical protein